ncbi:TIM-barrel domain-containing protein [Parasediminibacterium sp. JCM 36343]|uniref:TIM-barrel domain-containing protein n=1 Tax=Parasediminibacterium sp. JCM 36343 TaxID=3374279 RepID=UPI00397A6CFA
MLNKKILPLLSMFLLAAYFPTIALCEITPYSKLDDGVMIHLKQSSPNAPKLLKLQVITDNIIRVLASPIDSFITQKSLMVLDEKRPSVKWELKEKDGQIIVSTSKINAIIFTSNGSVVFTDAYGTPILAEKKEGGKTFNGVLVEGEELYKLKQVFELTANEGFYGLGQHQNGMINYNGQHVDLMQNNTEVAIPFLVSDKNYGILWDNYSITNAMDSRDYEPMSSLKLFDVNGNQGWLTATYASKKNTVAPIVRAESTIDYEFIEAMKNFPEGFKPADGIVTWEGFVQSAFDGTHHFLLKNAGYAKIWIDGKLLVEKWRQSWNPGTSSIDVKLAANTKHSFKIEWKPDGGESYLSCKWLKPLTESEQKEFSFSSEAGKNIDYYFVYGSNMDEVISGYRDITGKATMMPKWAMGLWQSRERYKTQDEILQTVSEFRKRKIPLDNIVLDWNYWEQDKWGSQQFDASRFADPAGMIKTLHEKYNTRFMISVWPKFYEGIDNYKYFDANGWLFKRSIADRRRDWIAQGYVSTFYDAFNPKARAAFWDIMNKNLFVKGIDAWWLDATEPDIYSNCNTEHRKQLMNPTALGSGTQYFNGFPVQNSRAVYEGQRKTSPNQRVFILTRSAYAGLQRYAAATWSGDIASRWEDFKNQIPAGINFSLSGLPYWTTDIGGFAVETRYEHPQGKDLEEWRELSTRWYQFGAFCPLLRVHGQFPYREIYNISPEGTPTYESILYYDRLRYRLMPYIYSLVGKTYHDNYTIMRGLVMDFGKDPEVKNIGSQFMFGPSILVNPVTDFNATTKDLYLPATTGWYDFYTSKYYEGGQHITAAAPLQTMPLYIKEGSIVPFGPAMEYTGQKAADTISLYVYTGKDASFKLYEDEGLNYNYENGAFANVEFTYTEAFKTLSILERKGSFEGMLKNRVFNIVWVKKEKPALFNLDKKPDAVVKYKGEKISVTMKQ